jgi:hypothetical protein
MYATSLIKYVSSSGTLQEESMFKWNIKSDYVETCNCDFGCPCNFNGFRTYGFCRTLVFFNIKKGDAAKTKIMKLLTPNLNFEHSRKSAFYSV